MEDFEFLIIFYFSNALKSHHHERFYHGGKVIIKKTSIIICEIGNGSSIFVSEIIRISISELLVILMSQTSESEPIIETFSTSTWFIHFDGLCNYLHSFQKQLAANFFKNNFCFPDQEYVGHYIYKSTEAGLEFFIKYFLRVI